MSHPGFATRAAAASVTLLAAVCLPLDAQSRDSIADSVVNRLTPVTIGVGAPVQSIGSTRRWLDTTDIRSGARPRTLSELLQARLPGMSVLRYGGDPSDGSRIRMRGMTTLLGDASPLVVIDGVPASTPERLGSSFSRTASSRFDDFGPEEIERIDVLSGVAAAALFGGGASNGAIVITTKRGVAGRPRWDAWARGDVGSESVSYPANYTQHGIDPATGAANAFCYVLAIANGQCIPSGQLDVWNPLESASPFRMGRYGAAGASVAGGPFGIKAYASVLGRTESAVLDDSWASRVNARLNAERELFGQLTIGGSLGYVDRRAKTRFDNIVLRGLTGTATDDVNRGYRAPGPGLVPPPATRHGDRVSRSARVEWRALSWLRIHGVTGKDEVEQRDDLELPPTQGSSLVGRQMLESSIVHGTAEARYRLGGSVDARTLLSYEELNRRSLEEEFRIDGAASSSRGRASSDRSWMIQQRIGIGGRAFVNAGARRTTAGRFGTGDALWQPSVDAAWDLGRVRRDVTLRLRVAYAVGRPSRDTAFLGFFLQPPGSPQRVFGPEQPREAELGVDATFGRRIDVGVALFDARTPETLVSVPVPQPAQSPTALVAAKVANQGLEVIARGLLVDRSETRWTATLTLAALRNRVSGLAFSPFLSGAGVRNGEPYGVLLTQPYTFVDANGDGLPSQSEITVGSSTPSGTVIPTREASLRSELALRRWGLALSASIDHRGGHRAYNIFDTYHCFFLRCRSWQDPSLPLAEKLRVVVGTSMLGRDQAYHESATYTRFAELTLEWRPVRRRVGTGSSGLTVAVEARNLVTWSGFGGPDPEVATTMSALPSTWGLATLPALPRTIGVRVELGTP